ncbi:uncharacterized protein LOC108664999 [Hyalella azteca]|uniref:Uncharacterized protein LOC108664999 n=1 Tax=Hyalella azteca TaxID=294128 RepID=A0A8B7N1V0_HYAAZ|nr:uncharacterized protein LOC108664999 [Hyalella azteca]
MLDVSTKKSSKSKTVRTKEGAKIQQEHVELADKEERDSDASIPEEQQNKRIKTTRLEKRRERNASKSKTVRTKEEKNILKRGAKMPQELIELADKEESDSDTSIPDEQKTKQIRTMRMEKRREKLHHKSMEALKYLLKWKLDRSNWKYNRKIQVHLIQSCLNPHVMAKDNFPHFLEYAASIKGGSSIWLKTLCEEKIKEYDSKQALADEATIIPKDLKAAYKRAKKILANMGSVDADQSS